MLKLLNFYAYEKNKMFLFPNLFNDGWYAIFTSFFLNYYFFNYKLMYE